MIPGLFIPQPVPDEQILLLHVPPYLDRPLFVDGVIINTRGAMRQSREDYWITRWGTINAQGAGKPLAEIDHGLRGISGRPTRHTFAAPMRLELDSTVYVEFLIRGTPAQMRGVSIVLRTSLRGRR